MLKDNAPSEIRIIQSHSVSRTEDEVNDLIEDGWSILNISTCDNKLFFIMGYFEDEDIERDGNNDTTV